MCQRPRIVPGGADIRGNYPRSASRSIPTTTARSAESSSQSISSSAAAGVSPKAWRFPISSARRSSVQKVLAR